MMQPHTAMALVHPFTREAIAFATRSMQGHEPQWERDPDLQNVLWNFAERIVQHAFAQPFVLEQLNTSAGQLKEQVFGLLPMLPVFVEEFYNYIHAHFSSLYGIITGASVNFCLDRIAYTTAAVAQAQQHNLDPASILQR
jgi:hypothetical protein